jgi:hypothetical protein
LILYLLNVRFELVVKVESPEGEEGDENEEEQVV